MLGGDQVFSSQMTAAFGENLVLNVKSCSSRVKEIADGSSTHLAFTEAGISVDDYREIGEHADVFDDWAELGEGSEADVWDSRRSGEGSSWNVDSFESMLGSQSGNESVEAPWNHQTLSGEQFPEFLAPGNELHLLDLS